MPGVAYLLDPLRARSRERRATSTTLTRLSQLKVGVPQSFADHRRAPGRLGQVSRGAGRLGLADPPARGVEASRSIAFTAECPHLGCAVNLAADGKSFLCPCHTSAFDFDGKPLNQIPPRPMDRLEVELSERRRPRGPRQVPAVPDPERGEDPPCLTNSPTGSTTGPAIAALVHEALEEPIPGGARWRYVFGSALTADVHRSRSSPACC